MSLGHKASGGHLHKNRSVFGIHLGRWSRIQQSKCEDPWERSDVIEFTPRGVLFKTKAGMFRAQDKRHKDLVLSWPQLHHHVEKGRDEINVIWHVKKYPPASFGRLKLGLTDVRVILAQAGVRNVDVFVEVIAAWPVRLRTM